ncbi:biotin transporter BioY [Nitratireductor sp. GCM10026969]|uniref:biotin transporter BioY n=1 Tax=Nitratireductor sp. GCM10026969 TaxID=3252645 RepID=UPI003620A9FE
MSNASKTAPRLAFSPLDLPNRSLGWQVAAVVLGSVLLTIASYVEVPMVPVPMTMQTFAVALVGALFGWRLGGITVLAWLAEGASGLPVLAGGHAGLHHFAGPTAGYLFAFPVMAVLTGWLAERGWNGRRVGFAFVSMLLAHGLCLALGAAWLATIIGVEQAIVHGVTPFLLGAVLKSALGAATLKALQAGKTQQAA